jgi:hypothetical protein
MKILLLSAIIAVLLTVGCQKEHGVAAAAAPIAIQAVTPAEQRGSTGPDKKAGSVYGAVLGNDWGSKPGDWARYEFSSDAAISPAYLHLRYAREMDGAARVRVTLDGKDAGVLTLPKTGGWGDTADQFQEITLKVASLVAGKHTLRLTVGASKDVALQLQKPSSELDLVGNRDDKNSVGHGVNVALYTGTPSKFFYATYEMGDVFNIVDGGTLKWFPDYTLVDPTASAGNANLDRITIDGIPGLEPAAKSAAASEIDEQRQVCVTKDDVVVSRVVLTNRSGADAIHHMEVAGDCRAGFDYRGKTGGEKATRVDGDTLLLVDKNAFPSVLHDGLVMAVGASSTPVSKESGTPGAYRLSYDIHVPAHGTKVVTFACAVGRDVATAKAHLAGALKQSDPVAQNRKDWADFYEKQTPSFTSSDAGLNEIYGLRWFLLKFSMSGGDLGYFQYPVDMEGRQAFQTYCCYSAPFMSFDLNWQDDPKVGFGQLANMVHVAYDDGRFPWYSTPETNRVPLDHKSGTGQSLTPWTAWRFYQIHGRKDLIAQLYDGMKKNLDWWIADRDPDGNGLFTIDHQLETGMDDLHRRWTTAPPKRYEAVDATSYAILNLEAVGNMARVLGKTADSDYYSKYAAKSKNALQTICWDPKLQRYRDRNPDNGELSDYNSITIFYPMFAGAATKESLGVIDRYLLNPKEYWTKYPVPALSQSDPEFDPIKRYWAGPTWPATNSHVLEGFAETAKRMDRSKMPEAGELFHRVAALHLQPRADFYEHYDPFTGKALSGFRDYMHSWWIDVIIRHAAGLEPQDDGSLVIDPLPMGLTHYALRGAPYRGHKIDVLWNEPETGKGLTVRRDGKVIKHLPEFTPGGAAVVIGAAG